MLALILIASIGPKSASPYVDTDPLRSVATTTMDPHVAVKTHWHTAN